MTIKTHVIESTFRSALRRAAITRIQRGNGKNEFVALPRSIALIGNALDRRIGLIRRRDWNAALSKRTYDTLLIEGVMPA